MVRNPKRTGAHLATEMSTVPETPGETVEMTGTAEPMTEVLERMIDILEMTRDQSIETGMIKMTTEIEIETKTNIKIDMVVIEKTIGVEEMTKEQDRETEIGE